MRPALMFACAVIATGCSGAVPVQTAPTTQTVYASALSHASDEAAAGRYGVADKMLADFAIQHPASSEAVEAIYWRAIYQLDPSNSAGSIREADALLGSYIAAPAASRRAEAGTLRRIATALDAAKSAAMAVSTAPPKAVEPSAVDKAKDDELARLKDELAKANAELDRIKRRLAKP